MLAFFAAIIFHSDYFVNLSWQVFLLTIAKTAGLLTSILLLVQSVDTNNPLVQKLCQNGGKTNCNDILSSKAAKVFEGLNWSEVGFFYFAGTWLFLLFGGGSAPILQLLFILNIISLPYTFYSIYYQAYVAKIWCVLCCTVQALLWVEFISLIASLHMPFISLTTAQISVLFISLAIPFAIWLLLKPLLLQVQQVHPLKVQLQKFKYDSDMFNKTLRGQAKYRQPNKDWSIVIGDANAKNTIVLVTNPYCNPCSQMHNQLNAFLENNINFCAHVIFLTNNLPGDNTSRISQHFMALNLLPDRTIVKRAMDDWYHQKNKNYSDWSKNYTVNINGTETFKLAKQNNWSQMAGINATPTILINGYFLPEPYILSDLKYMLDNNEETLQSKEHAL